MHEKYIGNTQDIRSKNDPVNQIGLKIVFFFTKNTIFLADLFFFVAAPFAENVFSWICFRISGVLPLYGKKSTKGSLSNRVDFPFLF